jgi:DNA replication and repair protein RecF
VISKLQLTNYRSYANHSFELHPQASVVVGPNATGKTNLLEAVYVLATTKSFRTKDPELIRHGDSYFRIEGEVDGVRIGLGFKNSPKSKQVDYNQVKRPLSRHIGNLPTVLFEPGDLQLLSGPPAARRRYLDGILAPADPGFRQALATYQRVLKQRNSLLERFDIGAVKSQVFAWDLNLTTTAATIVSGRQQLLDKLNQRIGELYGDIAGEKLELSFGYVPSIDVSDDYGETLLAALANNLPRDLGAGFTTIGPHREDFELTVEGQPVATVASRGEVRSLVLAMKLLELELATRADSPTPLLLLDDVFSELDESRRDYLTQRLGGVQSLITTTDADLARAINLDHSLIETSHLERYAVD